MATEPTTGYDYGKPHYTDENHIKHLLFDDNNIDNMTDEAKTSLFETRLANKEIGKKMNEEMSAMYKDYVEEYKILD